MPPSFTAIERVSAPVASLVSTADAKAHMRVDASDDDTLIGGLVLAAVSMIDGDGLLGRALITQDWAQWVPQSPGWVRLHIGPFQSLVSVQYYDADGVLQTATLEDFEARKDGDTVICKPKAARAWPTTEARADAIKITYRAGFGDAPTDVPDELILAAKMLAAHLYENREATISDRLASVPFGFDDLIGRHRVGWYG